MKKQVVLILSLFMSASLIQAETIGQKLEKGWQTTKQKAGQVKDTVVDAVNIRKYNRLYKEADQRLNACGQKKCAQLYNEWQAREKKRAPGMALNHPYVIEARQALTQYTECVKSSCPAEQRAVSKAFSELSKREIPIVVGSTLLTAAVLVGLSALGIKKAIEMDKADSEARRTEIATKINSLAAVHGLRDSQVALLQKVVPRGIPPKSNHMTVMLRSAQQNDLQNYITSNQITNLHEDNLLKALADLLLVNVDRIISEFSLHKYGG